MGGEGEYISGAKRNKGGERAVLSKKLCVRLARRQGVGKKSVVGKW